MDNEKYLTCEEADEVLKGPWSPRGRRITTMMIDQGCTYDEAKKAVDGADSLLK